MRVIIKSPSATAESKMSKEIPVNTTGYWDKHNMLFWDWLHVEAKHYPLRFISVPITSELGKTILTQTSDTTVNGDFTCMTKLDIVLRLPDCLIAVENGTQLTMFSQPFKVIDKKDTPEETIISSGPSAMYFLHRYPYPNSTDERPSELTLASQMAVRLVHDTYELKGRVPFANRLNYRTMNPDTHRWRKPTVEDWEHTNVAIMYPGDSEKLFGSGLLSWTCTPMFEDIPDHEKVCPPTETDTEMEESE